MIRKEIENTVEEFALPIVEKLNYELVDTEYVREGTNWYLRVYIDKPGGVSIDDCQAVSERISKWLDKEDPIEGSYFLEVSSPGLDRPLKKERDFLRYMGEEIEIKLFEPLGEKKTFDGRLMDFKDNIIKIKTNEGIVMEFDLSRVALAKRFFKW